MGRRCYQLDLFVTGHHGIGVGVFGREIKGGARAGQTRSSLAGGVVVVVGVAAAAGVGVVDWVGVAALVVCWLAGVGRLV